MIIGRVGARCARLVSAMSALRARAGWRVGQSVRAVQRFRLPSLTCAVLRASAMLSGALLGRLTLAGFKRWCVGRAHGGPCHRLSRSFAVRSSRAPAICTRCPQLVFGSSSKSCTVLCRPDLVAPNSG